MNVMRVGSAMGETRATSACDRGIQVGILSTYLDLLTGVVGVDAVGVPLYSLVKSACDVIADGITPESFDRSSPTPRPMAGMARGRLRPEPDAVLDSSPEWSREGSGLVGSETVVDGHSPTCTLACCLLEGEDEVKEEIGEHVQEDMQEVVMVVVVVVVVTLVVVVVVV
jgi:hypothetical protein